MVAETFLIRLKKYISSHSLTSLVLHSWTLYTVVLIIQLKCFPKSFLKLDWRYCSDTSRAQFPVTQHLLSKQPLQPGGTTYTKKAIALHTPITGLHLTAYPGEETKSAEMRIWEMHFLYNPQWRPAQLFHTWPTYRRNHNSRRKEAFFLSLLLGFTKDWTKNKLVTE